MSCSGNRVTVEIDEGTSPELRGQVVSSSGAIVLASAVDSIAYTVTSIETGTTTAGTPTLLKADCWSDTFILDDRWTKDTTGYNFYAEIPASFFLTGDNKVHRWQVEVRVTPASGNKFWAGIWVVIVNPVYTSLS